jgi:hypothetical protein
MVKECRQKLVIFYLEKPADELLQNLKQKHPNLDIAVYEGASAATNLTAGKWSAQSLSTFHLTRIIRYHRRCLHPPHVSSSAGPKRRAIVKAHTIHQCRDRAHPKPSHLHRYQHPLDEQCGMSRSSNRGVGCDDGVGELASPSRSFGLAARA